MASFVLKIASGAKLVPWLDPADGDRLSRLNPHAGVDHRRYLAQVGQPVVLHALIPSVGSTPPEDSTLAGKLFIPWWLEAPARVPFVPQASPAASAIITFTPSVPGHWVLCVRRSQGGAVIFPLDVSYG